MEKFEKLMKQVEDKIEGISEQGVQGNNLEVLGKLVDIQKDLKEIEHMSKGKSYSGEYGNYSEGGYGARGNYREGSYNAGNYNAGNYNEGNYGNDNYGRRGVKGTGRGRRRYRGDDMIDEMDEQYGRYSEGREQYREGNYGAEEQTMRSLEYMLDAVTDFVRMLKQDASSQKEAQLIDKKIKKLAEM